jgi:ferredoxin
MSTHVRVDPIACDAHGLCAELFPERIRLDDWGYPLVDAEPIPRNLEQHAKRAVAACPALALALVERETPSTGRDVRARRVVEPRA